MTNSCDKMPALRKIIRIVRYLHYNSGIKTANMLEGIGISYPAYRRYVRVAEEVLQVKIKTCMRSGCRILDYGIINRRKL